MTDAYHSSGFSFKKPGYHWFSFNHAYDICGPPVRATWQQISRYYSNRYVGRGAYSLVLTLVSLKTNYILGIYSNMSHVTLPSASCQARARGGGCWAAPARRSSSGRPNLLLLRRPPHVVEGVCVRERGDAPKS